MSLSQKSKSRKQLTKPKSSTGNISSRALLQLSSITCASRNDKNLLSERSLRQNQTFHNHSHKNSRKDSQNNYDSSLQHTKKNHQNRQCQKQQISQTSQVLKQLMKYENRQANNKKQYFQKQYDSMTILTKSSLMNMGKLNNKKKNNQKSQTKKLLLTDQNRTTNSSSFKRKYKQNMAVSAQLNHFQKDIQEKQQVPIICSIQINCLQNQGCFNIQSQNRGIMFRKSNLSAKNKFDECRQSNSNNKQYTQNKSSNCSNYNSRRSSISLCNIRSPHDAHDVNSSESKQFFYKKQGSMLIKAESFDNRNKMDKLQNCKSNDIFQQHLFNLQGQNRMQEQIDIFNLNQLQSNFQQLNFKKTQKNKAIRFKSNENRTRDSQKLQNQRETQQNQTKQNQTDITMRQRSYYPTPQNDEDYDADNQIGNQNQLLMKLQQLSILQEKLSKEAGGLSKFWDIILQTQENIANFQNRVKPLQRQHSVTKRQIDKFNIDLFQQNMNYVQCKKQKNNISDGQKRSILLQIDKIHNEVKKKVFKKDLQQIMIFNMKVVLPSHELNSTISSNTSLALNSTNLNRLNSIHPLQKNVSFSNKSFMNPNVIGIYQQLFAQKASKKYGMILKKQINNMNMYDCKTMSDYLKRLSELEIHYNKFAKCNLSDMLKTQQQYLQVIEKILQKIEILSQQEHVLQNQIRSIQQNIDSNKKKNQNANICVNNYINQLTENIEQQYHEFTEALKPNNINVQMKKPQIDLGHRNQNFVRQRCQNCRNQFVSFKKMAGQKYAKMFGQYSLTKNEKRLIQKRLNIQLTF